MPVRRTGQHTYRAARAQARIQAARQDLSPEEPMHRYPHPIDLCVPPAAGTCSDAELSRILEQLGCQTQLLMDLLGAVNALTAATLGQTRKG